MNFADDQQMEHRSMNCFYQSWFCGTLEFYSKYGDCPLKEIISLGYQIIQSVHKCELNAYYYTPDEILPSYNESKIISIFFPKYNYFVETGLLLQAQTIVRWSRNTVTLQVSMTLRRCSIERMADVCRMSAVSLQKLLEHYWNAEPFKSGRDLKYPLGRVFTSFHNAELSGKC